MSVGVYEKELHDAIRRGKFPWQTALMHTLGQLLVRQIENHWPDVRWDFVIAVPHHWSERLLGRHVPSETLTEGISTGLKVRLGRHILAKTRRTPKQTSLGPAERRRNLQGAFRVVDASRLGDATVLLVDDVMTTGTTAHRCAKSLLAAGARSVDVAVVARATGPGPIPA